MFTQIIFILYKKCCKVWFNLKITLKKLSEIFLMLFSYFAQVEQKLEEFLEPVIKLIRRLPVILKLALWPIFFILIVLAGIHKLWGTFFICFFIWVYLDPYYVDKGKK